MVHQWNCAAYAALLILLVRCFDSSPGCAGEPTTTLTNPLTSYQTVAEGTVRLTRGPIELVLVDNQAHRIPEAPHHRAGYNGIAVLKHQSSSQSLFVPEVAGLNFEHIHDGSQSRLIEKFEPRQFPMELRRIDDFTYELYQGPTKNFQLESCGRYSLFEDGVIEYTFQCIPRSETFESGFIGLFWASYIHQPDDLSIHFLGREADSRQAPRWINGVTPEHGVDATHPPANSDFRPAIDDDFPLTLVNHPSPSVHTAHWYYGISNSMAWLQVFRPSDKIWLAQSPSGGGEGNPAWDFQWFINNYEVGKAYGFVMRAAYVPYESRAQLTQLAAQMQQKLQ